MLMCNLWMSTVFLMLICHDADVHLVDLVLLLAPDGDHLDDVARLDPDVDPVDLDVTDPIEEAVVGHLVTELALMS